jgi:hypothetical protein
MKAAIYMGQRSSLARRPDMRKLSIFILAGVLTLGLAVGAMAFGGYGMMGGGYGPGWGGSMMGPGYHMGYANGPQGGPAVQGPAYGPGYGSAYCPGWQSFNNGQGPAYGRGFGPGPNPNYRRGPVTPNGPADNAE